MEAFNLAKAARCAAWRRLKVDSQGRYLRRSVRRVFTNAKRVRFAAFDRFLERHAQNLEGICTK